GFGGLYVCSIVRHVCNYLSIRDVVATTAYGALLEARLAGFLQAILSCGEHRRLVQAGDRRVRPQQLYLQAQSSARRSPHDDHVGLHTGVCDHLPLGVRMDQVRDTTGRYERIPDFRLRIPNVRVSYRIDNRIFDLSWSGVGFVAGDRRSNARDASTNARPRSSGPATV